MNSAVSPRILLVDDEQDFILTLAERLETRGFPSTVVHSGEDAIAAVGEAIPEVMLLDLNMPGIKGLDVLRWVKQQRHPTRVIILTGHGSEQEKARADDLGAFAYLTKPVDIEVLSDTIRRALDVDGNG